MIRGMYQKQLAHCGKISEESFFAVSSHSYNCRVIDLVLSGNAKEMRGNHWNLEIVVCENTMLVIHAWRS